MIDEKVKQKINKLGMLLSLASTEYNEVLVMLATLEAQEIKAQAESEKEKK